MIEAVSEAPSSADSSDEGAPAGAVVHGQETDRIAFLHVGTQRWKVSRVTTEVEPEFGVYDHKGFERETAVVVTFRSKTGGTGSWVALSPSDAIQLAVHLMASAAEAGGVA